MARTALEIAVLLQTMLDDPMLVRSTDIFLLWQRPQGDTKGNLVFRGTARNFNPECAKAGEYQPLGSLD